MKVIDQYKDGIAIILYLYRPSREDMRRMERFCANDNVQETLGRSA